MEEIIEQKQAMRKNFKAQYTELPNTDLLQKNKHIEERLFNFANFLESQIILFYINIANEVETRTIIQRTIDSGKVVVLPIFKKARYSMEFMKVKNCATDLHIGPRGVLEPNPQKCNFVPMDRIDIAIVPVVVVDDKGGRIGTGNGYYDRMLPKLPITCRKVSLAMEYQIVDYVPMLPHDRYIDIIISEKRIIYKI